MKIKTTICSLAPSKVTPFHYRTVPESYLANASHPGHDPLVAAFPRNLAEEEVDLVVVWVEGVRNGVSRDESALWGGKTTRERERVTALLVTVTEGGKRLDTRNYKHT